MRTRSIIEDGVVKDMKVNAPSNKGFWLSLAFFFSPLLYVIAVLIAALQDMTIAENPGLVYSLIGITILLVGLWASAIVRCVSEIARFYSVTGEVGLFILLVTPALWVMGVVVFVISQLATLGEMIPTLPV